jgi:hypothetical protein
MRDRGALLLGAVYTGLAGLLILGISVLAFVKAADVAIHGVRTTGTVVDFVSPRSCRSARISFLDRAGGWRVFNDDCPTWRHEGDVVQVLYVPARPTRARVENEVWNAPVFLLVVAAGLMGLSVGLLRRAQRS